MRLRLLVILYKIVGVLINREKAALMVVAV